MTTLMITTPSRQGREAFVTADSQAPVKALQASASPADLKGITFTSQAAAIRYLQIFNAASAPADGLPPTRGAIPINPGETIEWEPSEAKFFSTGLYVCSSTTQNTKTLSGNDDMWITVDFIPRA